MILESFGLILGGAGSAAFQASALTLVLSGSFVVYICLAEMCFSIYLKRKPVDASLNLVYVTARFN